MMIMFLNKSQSVDFPYLIIIHYDLVSKLKVDIYVCGFHVKEYFYVMMFTWIDYCDIYYSHLNTIYNDLVSKLKVNMNKYVYICVHVNLNVGCCCLLYLYIHVCI